MHERRQTEVTSQHGKNVGNIFGAHVVLLEDETLRYDLITLIRSMSYSAEYAVSHGTSAVEDAGTG